MPSFRFRGFTAASTVALTLGQGAQTAEANLVWAQALATSTATFQIARTDENTNDELVAPCSVGFTPVNITGLLGVNGQPISETPGNGNDYDPTAIEIMWSWSFGDPSYVPRFTPNIPEFMRDTNRAYTKRPWHVMHAPGNKTITLFGYDYHGNWGTATFTFGPDGLAPAIADPATHFVGRDVYFSQDGIFPEEVPAEDRCTTRNAANTRLGALFTAGATFARLRLRRGEDYVGIDSIGGGRNLYIDGYGPGLTPPRLMPSTTTNAEFSLPNNGNTLHTFARIIEIDWQGPYDAGSETGRRWIALFNPASGNARHVLLHRVRINGAAGLYAAEAQSRTRVFSDMEISNWQDYGVFLSGGPPELKVVVIGCDWFQKLDALSGTRHGTGNSNYANLTNRHGPVRMNRPAEVYAACSSFFSRNGWSDRFVGPGNGDTRPQTAAQGCWRNSYGEITLRNHNQFDRCSFEGGTNAIQVQVDGGAASAIRASNVVIEVCLFVSTADADNSVIRGGGRGFAMRNSYFYIPAVPLILDSDRHVAMVDWPWLGTHDPATAGRALAHNNSVLLLATNAQAGVAARQFANVNANHSPVIENNLYRAPNLSPTIGDGFLPLSTPTLAGFTPRFLGWRMNFPPIGHPLLGTAVSTENAREGGAGPVAPNEWISVPYPNYSAFCGGVLGQVTRSMVESALPAEFGGGARYHQISIHDHNVKASAPAAAGGGGGIAVAFTDTHIRVQNLSAVTWTGSFWLLLDLRDRLMGHIAASASPAEIQLLVPGAASTARGMSDAGLWARTDFLGAERSFPGTMGAVH